LYVFNAPLIAVAHQRRFRRRTARMSIPFLQVRSGSLTSAHGLLPHHCSTISETQYYL